MIDYTVEVAHRFKGLDLVDTEPEELWMEACNTVQEAVTKIIHKKKKCKKAVWLSEDGLQMAEERREAKDKGERERLHPAKCRVPERRVPARRDWTFFDVQYKKKKKWKKTKWERVDIFSIKLDISRECFMQGWAQ